MFTLWTALRYAEPRPRLHFEPSCRVPMVKRESSSVGTGDPSGILDLDFWREEGGVERWREMHDEPEDAGQVQLLKRCTYAGRPFGEEDLRAADRGAVPAQDGARRPLR